VQSARVLPGEYFSEKARVAVRDNLPAVAILNAVRGLQYDPANPDLYYHLGCARMVYGDSAEDPAAAESFYVDAIAAFEKAVAAAPQDEIYALELATALDAARRFEEAEWRFHQAIALDPKSASLRRYYEGHLEQWRTYKPLPAES
jgi:tetratricopeptide (TPR) repeat protein